MCWRSLVMLGAAMLPVLARSSEIYHLEGEGDYRFATLHWQSPTQLAGLHGFQVNYCEMQAWGPNRCRTKYLEATSGVPFKDDSELRAYSVIVNGLRMATNYSFEVKPRESRQTRFYMQPTQRWINDPSAKRIVVPTKGFSAKASLCLPDVSEVEVSTGPYFSGRIAVENSADLPQCMVDGDPSSSKDVYTLRIDHAVCGSKVNRTAVETFILVQENLPILTHSTRRFMVLCTFQPETLTVRAGLNLPHTSHGVSAPAPGPEAEATVDEVEDNDVQASALLQGEDVGRSHADQVTEAQTVMLVVIIAIGIVAIGLTVWWFMPIKSKSSRVSIISDFNSYTSNSTAYENYENSLRDSVMDFETVQDTSEEDREENAFSEGVYNTVLQESCSSLPHVVQPVPSVVIECVSQSEA